MVCCTAASALLLFNVLRSHALPRTATPTAKSALQVDVGYALYQGFPDENTGINAWLGIRYAAPPTGNQRWRAPQAPDVNRSQITDASAQPPRCPQTVQSPGPPPDQVPGGYQGDEDCLFLNVFAPEGAQNLPVMFYIHGGGYGAGNAGQNVTQITQLNDYGFVSVSIQYRLSAFGFLAGTAIHTDGVANAALLDQHFALEWVQNNIAGFGGDPRRVTLVGQSAGAGSIEMQALAYGGSEGTKFFDQGIASSPYTPTIYQYSDLVPEQRYLMFANQSGCYYGPFNGQSDPDPKILDCLRKADTDKLQLANYVVGSGVNYGSFAFGPVIDGDFIQQRPSQQFLNGAANGRRVLTSHNADDGSQFVNPNITSQVDFKNWLVSEYPMLSADDIRRINQNYPYRNESSVPFATCGDCNGPTNVNVGSYAVGHLQRAIDFYTEATLACPSYWLALAYQGADQGGYKYQFSIPPAQHGLDLVAESLIPWPNFLVPQIQSDFHLALTAAWGNFITTGCPSISNLLANGNSSGSNAPNAASSWPVFALDGYNSWQMLDFNETKGTLMNSIKQVDAYTWEGGQGRRCEFLRNIGASIPV